MSISHCLDLDLNGKRPAVTSDGPSKKRTNEFVFTSMRHVFVCFLEEIHDPKKPFRN